MAVEEGRCKPVLRVWDRPCPGRWDLSSHEYWHTWYQAHGSRYATGTWNQNWKCLKGKQTLHICNCMRWIEITERQIDASRKTLFKTGAFDCNLFIRPWNHSATILHISVLLLKEDKCPSHAIWPGTFVLSMPICRWWWKGHRMMFSFELLVW